MITKEQRLAFELMSPEAVAEEIEARAKMIGQLTGQLYNSILSTEIDQLREINYRKTAGLA